MKHNAAAAGASQGIEDDFAPTQGFKSYVAKPEITALDPSFLVKGSKNVLIDYANRVISRNGYSLYRQANNGGVGITSSYEWDTSTGKQFSLRSYGQYLEFDWNGAYNQLMSGLASPTIGFAQVNDSSEQLDVLIMVKGDANLWRWSGGAAKAFSSNATQVVKGGVLASTDLGTFTVTIASPAVFTLTGHGLNAGDTVQFTTTGALPTGLSVGTTYYVISTGLTANTFEVSATAGGVAINTSGTQSGVHTLYRNTRSNGIAFVAGVAGTTAATITDSNNNFLNAGFAAGDTLYVSGSANNSRQFTIGSVTAGTITLIMSDVLVSESAGKLVTLHNGEPTWKSSRFFSTISGRAILYGGTSYTYTGGEATDTLTGLSGFPTVTAGDAVWQAVNQVALPTAITGAYPNFTPNLIGAQLNAIFIGSTNSSVVFGSDVTDYTNFTLKSPRAPGDPMQMPLTNGYCQCIIPVNTDRMLLNVQSTLIFGSGKDAFDQIDFHMSADNTQELARLIRYKAAKGISLISRDAFCPIKAGTVYISREPALDSLGNLEAPDGKRDVPLSDLVKSDFDTYDFTNAHILYWKRAIYIAVPKEGLVLIYDTMRNLWQPPQTIPVSRLAIINDALYGHSSITNETYKLFDGTDDNGAIIEQVARFAYDTGGTRTRLKNLSSVWSDGYITASAKLTMKVYFGFEGQEGIKSMTIDGGDTSITTPANANPFGSEPIGTAPLGGAALTSNVGLPGAGIPLLRFYQDDSASLVDCIEHFIEYSMTTLGGQFAIVSHGTNQTDAGTVSISHKK